ncbi:ER membrane protein complex subunit 8 [Homalodisca vitripennis]|nr:ER membrane protein complex subunit 8 [Homalodisca vitripennis]
MTRDMRNRIPWSQPISAAVILWWYLYHNDKPFRYKLESILFHRKVTLSQAGNSFAQFPLGEHTVLGPGTHASIKSATLPISFLKTEKFLINHLMLTNPSASQLQPQSTIPKLPVMKSALSYKSIDHWASTEGLVISGYYVANESIRDTSIEKPANRIADKIAEHNSSACLVVIDNRLLSLTMEEPALIVSQFADVKWKTLEKSSWSVPESCLDTAATLLERRWQENVIDFDNHLDDITLDWRNKSANSAIDTYSSQ